MQSPSKKFPRRFSFPILIVDDYRPATALVQYLISPMPQQDQHRTSDLLCQSLAPVGSIHRLCYVTNKIGNTFQVLEITKATFTAQDTDIPTDF